MGHAAIPSRQFVLNRVSISSNSMQTAEADGFYWNATLNEYVHKGKRGVVVGREPGG